MEKTNEEIALDIAVKINSARGMSTTSLLLKDADLVMQWLNEQQRITEPNDADDAPAPSQMQQNQAQASQTQQQARDPNTVWGTPEPEVDTRNTIQKIFGVKKKSKNSVRVQYQDTQGNNTNAQGKAQLPPISPITAEQRKWIDNLTKRNPIAEAYTNYYISTLKKKRIADMIQPEAEKLLQALEDKKKTYTYESAFRAWYLNDQS